MKPYHTLWHGYALKEKNEMVFSCVADTEEEFHRKVGEYRSKLSGLQPKGNDNSNLLKSRGVTAVKITLAKIAGFDPDNV